MDRSKIAVFDSGVGGITMLYRLIDIMPREDYLYFADSAHTPYGNRTDSEVTQFVHQAVAIINQEPLKALVIACNTATSGAIEELREKYSFPIIGMEPAVKPAMRNHDPRKILLAATPLILRNSRSQALISNLELSDVVVPLPLQELVDYAEEFDFDSPGLKRYLRQQIKAVQWDAFHSLVLGCTHFLYFRELIKDLIPSHVSILDGHQGTARRTKQLVQQEMVDRNYTIDCSLSGKKVATEIIVPYLNHLKRLYEHRKYWIDET